MAEQWQQSSSISSILTIPLGKHYYNVVESPRGDSCELPVASWKLLLSVVIMGQMSREEITRLNLPAIPLFLPCSHALSPYLICALFFGVVNISGLYVSQNYVTIVRSQSSAFLRSQRATAAWPHVVAALIKTSAAYNYGFVVAVPVPSAQCPALSSPFFIRCSQLSVPRLSVAVSDSGPGHKCNSFSFVFQCFISRRLALLS